MKLLSSILLLSFSLFPANASEEIYGVKYSNSDSLEEKNLSPVTTKALLPDAQDFQGGFNEFLPFIVPSPDQENAGSCLFMSHTAITEVLINRNRSTLSAENLDLSERYLMNLSKASIGEDLIKNWKTDTIFRFNKTGVTYQNQDFPYMKGWYKMGAQGLRVFATEQGPGAYYGVKANWVIALDQLNPNDAIKTPHFSRDVLFEDPKGNRWNVATAPSDIVEKVKAALNTLKGPVLVIYNHTGFWHAVMIAGYNDSVDTQGCPFVSNFPKSMSERARQIKLEAFASTNQEERAKLLGKARQFQKRADQVERSYNNAGGCAGKGAFYVRDSIYPTDTMPTYDYDPQRSGEEKPLNPPVILREYEWLRHLANHVVQIYVTP
ncbi:MAG: hypothetical protein K9K67_10890 [Bacteriovoracaceae bacterium]|nr:hypothetical protein [Bacteriovoracaceae bacterium]